MNMLRSFLMFVLMVACVWSAQAQMPQPLEFGQGFGGQIGVSFGFGSHRSRVGFIAKLFYAHEHVQVNLDMGAWYCGETLGSERSTWEGMLKLGIVGTWGKKDSLRNPFLHEVSNQTRRRFAAGYSYNWYFNQIKTSQFTGTFGMQFDRVRFLFENDFLAFQSQDKYRTGAMGLWYRQGNWEVGAYHAAWTGDPYTNAEWIKNKDAEHPFRSRFGYIDMSNAPYGDKSVGALAVQVRYLVPVIGQILDLHAGVDAEQIRNAFQNRLIHDSPVLPINWGKNGNPHIPMVCTDGKPYLYRPEQRIRKPRPLLQLGWNDCGWW